MQPFDMYVWAEDALTASGLTGITAKGPTPIKSSGDLNTVRSGIGTPFLFGLGSLADTQPQGCALTPSRSNFGNNFYGPGAIKFSECGFMDLRVAPLAPKQLQSGETLSGLVSNTAVSSGALVAALIAYGKVPPLMGGGARYENIFIEQYTITSAAAATAFSGKVSLDTATTDDLWINTENEYAILGLVGCIGAATFGGVMHVTGLGGEWQGAVPGILVNPLSAVDFSPGPFVAAASPIPFKGSALPDVSMIATSAGAISGGIVIAEL
jgi:hypothetical protein